MEDTVLGFGDARGFYDFDTMMFSVDTDDTTLNLNSIIDRTSIIFHERNHWAQQAFTSFGNFSSIRRIQISNLATILWTHLPKEFRASIKNGEYDAPFAEILNSELTDDNESIKTILALIPEAEHRSIKSLLKDIQQYVLCGHLMSQTDWFKDDKERKRYCFSLFRTLLLIFTLQENNRERFDEIADFCGSIAYRFETELADPNSEIQRINIDLWDTSLILEASCVAQELFFAKQFDVNEEDISADMHRDYKRSSLGQLNSDSYFSKSVEKRFHEITTSNYSAPLKQILKVLGLQWNANNIIKCAGLITHIVEVALNPNIPPRYTGVADDLYLSKIHPSVRFASIINCLKGLKTSIASFNEFSEIPVSEASEMTNLYLLKCSELAELARLPFENRLHQRYFHGKSRFKEVKDLFRKKSLEHNLTLRDIKFINDRYPFGLAIMLLDIGYNSIHFGKGGLQNTIMLDLSFHNEVTEMMLNVRKARKRSFEDYFNHGLPFAPWVYFIEGTGHITPFIGKKTQRVFFGQNLLGIIIYNLLFKQGSSIHPANIPNDFISEMMLHDVQFF